MDKTVLIQRDVLDVVKRIKEIDRGYSVRYNLTRSRYEVCHIRSAGEPVLVLPYQKLDYRAVEYVRKTRLERLNEIIREITENNEKLERERERRIMDETAYKARHLAMYVTGGGRDIPSYDEI
jgi:hypothetical protein